jgi:hypothetical protein
LVRTLGGPQSRSGCGGEDGKSRLCPYRESNPDRPALRLVTTVTELSWLKCLKIRSVHIEKREGKRPVGRIGVDGTIILEWILGK